MTTGTIKFYDDEKGFGFIARPGLDDLFFHHTGLHEGYLPRNGDEVTYTTSPGKKGEVAMRVRPAVELVTSRLLPILAYEADGVACYGVNLSKWNAGEWVFKDADDRAVSVLAPHGHLELPCPLSAQAIARWLESLGATAAVLAPA